MIDPDEPSEDSDASMVSPSPDEPSLDKVVVVSLMITKRQRAELKRLGFSDDAIRDMRPADAHGHLGL